MLILTWNWNAFVYSPLPQWETAAWWLNDIQSCKVSPTWLPLPAQIWQNYIRKVENLRLPSQSAQKSSNSELWQNILPPPHTQTHSLFPHAHSLTLTRVGCWPWTADPLSGIISPSLLHKSCMSNISGEHCTDMSDILIIVSYCYMLIIV